MALQNCTYYTVLPHVLCSNGPEIHFRTGRGLNSLVAKVLRGSAQLAGFNLTFRLMGNNRTVQGAASQVPSSSLQPVQPQWGSALNRLNLTVRLQGAGVVPFSAALQRELVSALLHVTFALLCLLFTCQSLASCHAHCSFVLCFSAGNSTVHKTSMLI